LAHSEIRGFAWRGASASLITTARQRKTSGIEIGCGSSEKPPVLDRQRLTGGGILPATRFADEAYVNFVSAFASLESVASS